ncbi:unnamed protein product [Urochloa humidicola]
MEAPPRKHETTRGERTEVRTLRPLEVIVRCLRAVASFLFWRCLGGLGALLRRLVEAAAAFFLFRRGRCSGGRLGGLRQLIELSGTALNQSVNPEHIFAGFVLLNLGAAMAILTLAGARPGRAAAQMERFLRRFF